MGGGSSKLKGLGLSPALQPDQPSFWVLSAEPFPNIFFFLNKGAPPPKLELAGLTHTLPVLL